MFLYLSAMKRYKQFQSIVISEFEAAVWPHPVHKHNHYELIVVRQGSGTHHICGNSIAYRGSAIFLLARTKNISLK
jgi:AraC family L-rhamnose operon regulatory protein RhaS